MPPPPHRYPTPQERTAAKERVVPAAPRRRTGERRTNKQRESQDTARPREAYAKEYNSK